VGSSGGVASAGAKLGGSLTILLHAPLLLAGSSSSDPEMGPPVGILQVGSSSSDPEMGPPVGILQVGSSSSDPEMGPPVHIHHLTSSRPGPSYFVPPVPNDLTSPSRQVEGGAVHLRTRSGCEILSTTHPMTWPHDAVLLP
jgi:hypothetical protein